MSSKFPIRQQLIGVNYLEFGGGYSMLRQLPNFFYYVNMIIEYSIHFMQSTMSTVTLNFKVTVHIT